MARHDITRHHHPPALQEIPLEEAEKLQPVEHRQEEMVGDHGRHGHRTDHDHPHGRGKTAEKDEERQPLLAGLQGEFQHEGVGCSDRQAEQQASHGDGKDKDVDQKHVEREQPHGGADMVLVEVFDDGNMKLPRQKNDGRHRQQQVGRPGHVILHAGLGLLLKHGDRELRTSAS